MPHCHPFVRTAVACQPATTQSASHPSTQQLVRPRPRRCRLFVTIGQKFHCNRYATHRHHRPSSKCNPNVCQPSQLPPNHPATHHTICQPATLSASAQRALTKQKTRAENSRLEVTLISIWNKIRYQVLFYLKMF